VKPLSVEISEDQLSELDEVIENNPGWNKALIIRALLIYFIKMVPSEQEAFIKKHSVKKKAKKRIEEVEK
jgi:hypothetical protein